MTASRTVGARGRRAGAAVWLMVMVGTACGAGAVRPRFTPFREAISDTLTIAPDSAITLAASLLHDSGIVLHHVRPIEGYLQTRWFNVTSRERVSPQSADRDARAIIRIWADAVSEHQTLVIAEASMARVVDPSLPAREREMPVPDDHPARAILAQVLAGLRTQSDGRRGGNP